MILLFFIPKNMKVLASNTKAAYCVTTKQLTNILPNNCKPIVVENVLISTAKITKFSIQMPLQMTLIH